MYSGDIVLLIILLKKRRGCIFDIGWLSFYRIGFFIKNNYDCCNGLKDRKNLEK